MAKKSTPALIDHPGYAVEKKKLDELQRQKAALEQSIAGIDEVSRIASEAEALLAGKPAPKDAAPAELYHKLRVLTAAVDGQEKVVQAQVREASRSICEKLLPEHKAIVARIDDAFRALHAAFVEQQIFLDSLESQQVGVVPPITQQYAPFDIAHAFEQWQSQYAGYNQ